MISQDPCGERGDIPGTMGRWGEVGEGGRVEG